MESLYEGFQAVPCSRKIIGFAVTLKVPSLFPERPYLTNISFYFLLNFPNFTLVTSKN